VLTEAMASGLAVAGFDYAAARQFVVHGRTGLSVPVDEPEALVESAVLLATDGLLRAHVRQHARSAVESQSWEAVIGGFETELAAVARVRIGGPAVALNL